MGTSERKEREKERKKALMLKAAEDVILEKGLDSLNMDDVARRAEVSKGSLYQYFRNKTELVLGICAKASSLLSRDISSVLTKDIPGIEMVYTMGATFLTFVGNHPEFFRAMRFFDNLNEVELSESEYVAQCQANKERSFTSMVRAIQIGIQDGTINPSYEPRELAVLLWATSQGMVNMAYLHQNSPHFHLLEQNKIEVKSLFKNYMKMIGCGIAEEGVDMNVDSKSFFETETD